MGRAQTRTATAFTAAILLTLSGHVAAQSDDVLLGLWGAEKVFPPAASIAVVVEQDGDELVAHASGSVVPVISNGDGLSFTLPHGQGSFRGARDSDTRQIVGHWISEPAELLYAPLAAPLALNQVDQNTWMGSHQPIEQRFSLYVLIERDDEGVLRAFLRNPERNQGVFTRLDSVTRDGSDVRFLDADSNLALRGFFDEDSGQLSVAMPWRGGTYDLTRRERSEAAGFYPRRDTSAYQYRTPSNLNDGWPVASPDDVGVDTAVLTSLVQSIVDTQITNLRTPYIHSVVVARHGKLILDEYFYDHHAARTHDLRSSSKSITGLMVGRMISESEDIDVSTPVYPYFDESLAEDDPRKASLQLQHLLSMRGGFACDDNDYESPGNEDRMQEQQEQQDWYQFTLALPMAATPGEASVYCSGAINLLGGFISAATDTWLPDFFRSRFAEPMQIENYYYNLDPLKRGYAGGGIQLRPRDFLKFGQIMLDGGEWNGTSIIPGDWVTRSFGAHGSIYEENDYGYTWWRSQLPYRDGTVAVFSATGNGGQLLIVIPELELVVGFNGGNYGDFRTWIAWRDVLVPDFILEAIVD